MTILMTGCGSLAVEVTDVKSDACAWVKPIWLSEPSIKALRDAQEEHPEVRADREAIVLHNKITLINCPPDTE